MYEATCQRIAATVGMESKQRLRELNKQLKTETKSYEILRNQIKAKKDDLEFLKRTIHEEVLFTLQSRHSALLEAEENGSIPLWCPSVNNLIQSRIQDFDTKPCNYDSAAVTLLQAHPIAETFSFPRFLPHKTEMMMHRPIRYLFINTPRPKFFAFLEVHVVMDENLVLNVLKTRTKHILVREDKLDSTINLSRLYFVVIHKWYQLLPLPGILNRIVIQYLVGNRNENANRILHSIPLFD